MDRELGFGFGSEDFCDAFRYRCEMPLLSLNLVVAAVVEVVAAVVEVVAAAEMKVVSSRVRG